MDYVFVVQLHKRDSLKDIFQLFSDIYQVRGDCHVFIMSNDANQLVQLRENIEKLQKRIPYWTTEIFLKSSSKLSTCLNRFNSNTKLIWIDSDYIVERYVIHELVVASLNLRGYGFIFPYCEQDKQYRISDIYEENPSIIEFEPDAEQKSTADIDICSTNMFCTTINNYLIDNTSSLIRGIALRRLGFRNILLTDIIVEKKENKNDTDN